MGVYIKDYDIPSGECEHLILDFTTMKAMAVFGNRKQYDIVSLKTPHGRLIDADELWEHIGRDRLDSRELIMKMVDNAPTVIEAEVE